jgi:hypothetical protein
VKRFTIRMFAIFGAAAFVLWVEGVRAYHIEQSSASPGMPSLLELHKTVAARSLPTESIEDMSLMFPAPKH